MLPMTADQQDIEIIIHFWIDNVFLLMYLYDVEVWADIVTAL